MRSKSNKKRKTDRFILGADPFSYSKLQLISERADTCAVIDYVGGEILIHDRH